MIRYLLVVTVLALLMACGELAPTPWPTNTPVSTSGATAASDAEPAGTPDTSSGDTTPVAPNDTTGESATGERTAGESAVGDDSTPVSNGASSGEESSGAESEAAVLVSESGLQIKILVLGTGEQPRKGDTVVVHYTGWLLDGTKFDSSVDKDRPLEFKLGQGAVIEGWDEGVANMRVGGKRELTIPPELAYGDQQRGPIIKPGSTLVFEVELLEVKQP